MSFFVQSPQLGQNMHGERSIDSFKPQESNRNQTLQVRVNPASQRPAPKISSQQKQIMRRLEKLGILSDDGDTSGPLKSESISKRFQNPLTIRPSVAEGNSDSQLQIKVYRRNELDSTFQNESQILRQELHNSDTTQSRIQRFKQAQTQYRTIQARSEVSPSHADLYTQQAQASPKTHKAYEEYNLPLPILPRNHNLQTTRGEKVRNIWNQEQPKEVETRHQYSISKALNQKSVKLKTSVDIQPRAQMLVPKDNTIQRCKRTSDQFLAEVMQDLESKQRHRDRGKIMQGQTTFQLPDSTALKKHLHNRDYHVKLGIVDQMSQEDDALKGLINLSSSKERMIQRIPQDQLEQYVQNFCSPGSPNAKNTLKMVKPTKKLKVEEHLIQHLRAQAQPQVNNLQDTGKTQTLKTDNDQTLSLLGSPNSQVISVGQDFLKKMSYVQFFKQKAQLDVTTDQVQMDARIQYYINCKKDLNIALPILDKIVNKTLCLQNYTLLDGHCKSLAHVLSLLDSRQLQGILLYNCGIDGKQFARILEQLQQLTEFKSITYKQNMFSVESLQALEPFLVRPYPQNLSELNLVDVKISTNCCEELLKCIMRENYLAKLSLVNLNLNERQFEILLNIVKQSQFLESIDFSWCEVKQQTYVKVFDVLSQNVELKSIVLQWNSILDEKEQTLNAAQQQSAGETETLSPKNAVVIENICKFIQNNPKLILVGLQNTGLSELALSAIVGCLPTAVYLQCINLSGNPGISQTLIDRINLSLDASITQSSQQVKQLQKKKQDQDIQQVTKKGRQQKKVAMNFEESTGMNTTTSFDFRKGLNQNQEDELEQLTKIQEGIKLRNIQQISQINDMKLGIISTDRQHLTIYRKLGFEKYIENAQRWCINQTRQECYISDLHMFTMVVWNQVIGTELCASAQEVKHYSRQLGPYKEKSGQDIQSPQILGTFNNWQLQNMIDLFSFVMENDPNPPDFIWHLIEEGKCRQLCRSQPDEMDEDEAQALQEKRSEYYNKELLKVLKSISPFKNPQFALIDQIDPDKLHQIVKDSQNKAKLWLWMDFVKPGRHNFCVRTPPQNIDGSKAKAGFYVHQMWSQMRTENFPHLNVLKKKD